MAALARFRIMRSCEQMGPGIDGPPFLSMSCRRRQEAASVSSDTLKICLTACFLGFCALSSGCNTTVRDPHEAVNRSQFDQLCVEGLAESSSLAGNPPAKVVKACPPLPAVVEVQSPGSMRESPPRVILGPPSSDPEQRAQLAVSTPGPPDTVAERLQPNSVPTVHETQKPVVRSMDEPPIPHTEGTAFKVQERESPITLDTPVPSPDSQQA